MGRHKVWCDTRIPDFYLPCNCKPGAELTQHDLHIRRQERERCAKVCDVFAQDAHFEYSNDPARAAAADLAKRIARSIRLMED